MHLSLSRPTHPRSGRGGDLQELFDKFPTRGDDFMLQIPHKSHITPLVWGGEMQEIESNKLRSNWGLKYGREDYDEFSFNPFKLWVPLYNLRYT